MPPPFLRRIFLSAASLLLIAAAAAMSRAPAPADMRVTVEQLGQARLRVDYELRRPRRELIFKDVVGGYRARRWAIETPDFKLLRLEGEDRITRADGKKFDRVRLIADPDIIRLPKEYQPVARYGRDGALVYTGHFWPIDGRGARVNATFSFVPAPGGRAVAFGVQASSLKDWRSPMAHPAFVYMGPLQPVETAHVTALVDPDAPPWIVDDFYRLTPKAFDYLAQAFDFTLSPKPNLFMAAPLGGEAGRLSYAGDALPGQFQITLEGGAWKNPTAKAKSVFRRSTLHEAFHLWQSAAVRPSVEDTAAWIHEGGADAVAAEAMVALGFWDNAERDGFIAQSKRDCSQALEDGSLSRAQERRAFRALYACGLVIAEAVALADGTTATDFWRDFLAKTRRRGDYSERFFYDFVATRAGDAEFAQALRYFVETPLAEPDREIERLMAAAKPPLAPPARR